MYIPIFTDSPYGSLDTLALQRKWMWNILLPLPINLPFSLPFNLNIPEPGIVSGKAIGVTFGLPEVTEIYSMDSGNKKNKSPEHIDVGDVNIRMLEVEFSFMLAYFRFWWSQVMATNGVYNPQSQYKRTILAMLLTTKAIPNTIYRLEGCFPKKLPSYNLDYTSNDLVVLDVTLSCDYADVLI